MIPQCWERGASSAAAQPLEQRVPTLSKHFQFAAASCKSGVGENASGGPEADGLLPQVSRNENSTFPPQSVACGPSETKSHRGKNLERNDKVAGGEQGEAKTGLAPMSSIPPIGPGFLEGLGLPCA